MFAICNKTFSSKYIIEISLWEKIVNIDGEKRHEIYGNFLI